MNPKAGDHIILVTESAFDHAVYGTPLTPEPFSRGEHWGHGDPTPNCGQRRRRRDSVLLARLLGGRGVRDLQEPDQLPLEEAEASRDVRHGTPAGDRWFRRDGMRAV